MLGNVSSLYGSAYNQYGALGALPGVGGLPRAGSSSPVSSLNRQESSYQVKLSAYGKLQSAMESFKTALGGFKSASDAAPFKAASSEEKTLTAKAGKETTSAGQYDVNVAQLAKAQTLTSGVVADKDATIIGTGSITLQTGAYNAGTNTFTPAGSGKTLTISAGTGTLSGVASAINAADAGVKASVVQGSGGYQLSLTSTRTGTDNTIKLTVADNDNTSSDLAGLSALAFDPAAGPSGYGKNLTETGTAQNAQLTVNGASVVSQSNTVSASAAKGVTLNLAATGSATVNVARDAEAFAATAQKFVDAYNALQKSVKALSSASLQNISPPLASDRLTANLSNEVGDVVAQAAYGYGNNKVTLSSVGIAQGSNGTLALDKDKLQSAFASSPDAAAALLANAADRLSNVVTRASGTDSGLGYATRTLNKALQGVQNQKSLLQNYSSGQTYFGLPAQPSLTSYIPKANASAQAGRYMQVSELF
jgi:flagellar hook-associated protein 2